MPVVGAVAFSLFIPAAAEAQIGLGRPAAAFTPQPIVATQLDQGGVADRKVFWPYASDDLLEYAFFPKGNDQRFWTYGFNQLLVSAFAAGDATPARRNRRSDAAGSRAPDPCGGGRTAYTADRMTERIEHAIGPDASQQKVLATLRAALDQAIERIKTACPAAAPTTPGQRLQAIQDRIWAMRDALLIIRLPFEALYGSLTDEQLWHLVNADPDTTDDVAITGNAGPQACGERAGIGSDWPIRAIERALRPTEQQRAILQELRMRLAGMARLIGSSCPDYPLLGATDRLAAAGDRLDVMLFAVMALSPALPDFYESLGDAQKARLNRAIRQARRTAF